jgi:polar amino acid transport system substrate-binding protein
MHAVWKTGVLLAGWLLASASIAAPLVLLTEEYPPFNMRDKDGQIIGLGTDIVRALMKQQGLDYTIEMAPWARAMNLARTRTDHCVFSMGRVREREKSYSWIGPIATNDWSLFAKMPTGRHPKSLEDIKGARIGSYYGDGGVAFLTRRGFRVDVAPRDEFNPRKLQLNRIDYWATGKWSGQYWLKTQGIDGIEPVLMIQKSEMYLACNLAMPATMVKALNAALAELRSNGELARINARYGYTP